MPNLKLQSQITEKLVEEKEKDEGKEKLLAGLRFFRTASLPQTLWITIKTLSVTRSYRTDFTPNSLSRWRKGERLRRCFCSQSKEESNRERKTKQETLREQYIALRLHMKKDRTTGALWKAWLLSECVLFSILVVIASQWDLRVHSCFDIWPITKLLLICCELPTKQCNLVSEQRLIH